MDYLGPVTLGDTLNQPIVTKTNAGVPTDADSTPTCTVYDTDGETALLTPTITTISGDGRYKLPVAFTEGNGFAKGGLYSIIVSYAISETNLSNEYTVKVS